MRDGFIGARASISTQFLNGVTTPPVNTNSFTVRSGTAPAPGQSFVVAAAGDGAGGETSETNTTNLIASWNPNMFLYLGDVYEKGTATEFYNWYGPSGRLLRTLQLDHEPDDRQPRVQTGPGARVLRLLGQRAALLQLQRRLGGTSSASTRTRRSTRRRPDPAVPVAAERPERNTQPCTLVYYHQPLYNIGEEGPSTLPVRLLVPVCPARRRPGRQRPRPHLPALAAARRRREPGVRRRHGDHRGDGRSRTGRFCHQR